MLWKLIKILQQSNCICSGITGWLSVTWWSLWHYNSPTSLFSTVWWQWKLWPVSAVPREDPQVQSSFRVAFLEHRYHSMHLMVSQTTSWQSCFCSTLRLPVVWLTARLRRKASECVVWEGLKICYLMLGMWGHTQVCTCVCLRLSCTLQRSEKALNPHLWLTLRFWVERPWETVICLAKVKKASPSI